MSFIRIKKVKGKDYAYLVKSKWTKKGPRQKASKYLGLIRKYTVIDENLTFEDFIESKFSSDLDSFFDKLSAKEIIDEILFFELKKHGFNEYLGKRKTKKLSVLNVDCVVDLNYLKVYDLETEKPLCLSINSDFLCEYTLKKIYNFMEYGTELDIAKKLAKTFISCGIPLENDIFIRLFKKTFSKDKLKISDEIR